ncbi:LytR/AlgR family response regulator transcription factor [Desulfosporosinus fructosivorans]
MLRVKTIIVDDESGVSLLLGSILSELEGALVVGTAENAIDAMKLVKDKSPSLAFLDIELPDMTGIDLAKNMREIQPDLAIVFVTAHHEYSLDAFKVFASDYILKPIDKERVKTTFAHIQQTLKTLEKDNSITQPTASRISINLGNERVFVNLGEIFYIEKSGRYTVINAVNGKFKTRQTLIELEQCLGPIFFRSHKSYIINTDRIERIVTYPNSSYYEVNFENYKDKALLSRDRIHELMKYSHYNV